MNTIKRTILLFWQEINKTDVSLEQMKLCWVEQMNVGTGRRGVWRDGEECGHA